MRMSDWSSDVCSSDLPGHTGLVEHHLVGNVLLADVAPAQLQDLDRSDERRVGKECVSPCRSRLSPSHYNHNHMTTPSLHNPTPHPSPPSHPPPPPPTPPSTPPHTPPTPPQHPP